MADDDDLDDDDVDGDGDDDDDAETHKHPIGKLHTVNLVATFKVNTIVPLPQLIHNYPLMFTKHQQNCKFRLKNPKTTFKLFASGNALLVGAKTLAEANAAIWLFVGILKTHGVPSACVRDIQICNNTSTTRLGRGLFDLAKLDHTFAGRVEQPVLYKPSLFPGAQIRFDDLSLAVLAFMSNKINITGAKTVHDVEQALLAVREIHSEFSSDDPKEMVRIARTIEIMRQDVPFLTARAQADQEIERKEAHAGPNAAVNWKNILKTLTKKNKRTKRRRRA